MKSLRIVFMGTPEFAVESLRALVGSRHTVVAVVTVADKPAGRGQSVQSSPVKKFAAEHGITVLQPLKLKDPDFLHQLKLLNADLFVVVAFRMLPVEVWNMPPLGTINLHGSLLPQYRGAAPINRAIMNGENKTGVTTFFLQQEIDTGNIIMQTEIPISPDETAGELHDRMMITGAETLAKTVDLIADGKADAIPQDGFLKEHTSLKQAPKIFKEDCRINFDQSLEDVHNFIRGLSPYPAAWTMLENKTLKIFRGHKEVQKVDSTELWKTDGKTYLKFRCNNGWYHCSEVQLEGKKRMEITEFLRGWRAG